MQLDSAARLINEAAAKAHNFLSLKDILGKSVLQYAEKNCAENLMNNDGLVIKSEKSIVKEEICIGLKGEFDFQIQAVSFKFPLYNLENKVIGVLGCSIEHGVNSSTSLADSLSILTQTGLLAGKKKNPYDALLSNQLFTKRENEVLFYCAQGKTAKEIATILCVSHRTVEHHIEKMKIKSNCASKPELIDKAISLIRNAY